jgi:DNA-binding NarL/FixJ family response regulator
MSSITGERNVARRPRVLLADDHALILEGFRTVLGSECELIGELCDGVSLVKAALELQPDIVMLDIGLPGLNGIEAARQIRKALPRTRIVFVTMHASPSYLRAALAAGADGYVLKTSVRDELLVAVRQVLGGQIFVTAGFGEEILESYHRGGGREFGSPSPLTSRQRQILQLIAEGRTAKEMAATLNVSLQTVAFHKTRIMNRLSIRTTAELTKYAIKEGITAPLF